MASTPVYLIFENVNYGFGVQLFKITFESNCH
jgi:hypothetical protein